MRRSVFLVALFVAIAASMSFPRSPRTEIIPHHGLEVEADGTADDCLGCHDGFVARNASFCTVKCDFRGSHPILKRYPPLGKESSFVPLEVLAAKAVKLEQGQITCISCHNLHNSSRYHLSIDNAGDKLCYACHLSQGL
jgi:predicted CXXCH cytochrome family protein